MSLPTNKTFIDQETLPFSDGTLAYLCVLLRDKLKTCLIIVECTLCRHNIFLKIGLSNFGKKETVLATCTTCTPHFPITLFAGLYT
jgi:hypothetical protein